MPIDEHRLKRSLIPIETYKEPTEFANKQLHIMWFPDEIKVEKDIQDVLTNFTPAEKHGVITTLKLFSLYELFVGDEFWGTRFVKMFPEPEFHKMASVFSMTELAVHAPFYKKINELLHIDNEQFYTSYVQDSALKERIEFIDDTSKTADDMYALGVFSMVEGAILYSNFAYLKHFQSQGKNKLNNVVRGLNFSLRDEFLHFTASSWAFKLKIATGNFSQEYLDELKTKIVEAANKLYEHECRIIEMIFEKGPIDGITKTQLEHFVQSRINECLIGMGYEKIFVVKYNPIAEWFYKAISDYQFNDFFAGVGNQYQRDWDELGFTWETKK
jgi:ribonucleotide reductase beta subunit family protein with ferritin-like domain